MFVLHALQCAMGSVTIRLLWQGWLGLNAGLDSRQAS
jgi:ammonia channel protein AmtB